jgi:DNA repair protein RecO (recombination protein O)
MLDLPDFLSQSPGRGAACDQLDAAWKLNAFFLNRDVYGPRGIEPPDARAAFIAAIRKLTVPSDTSLRT